MTFPTESLESRGIVATTNSSSGPRRIPSATKATASVQTSSQRPFERARQHLVAMTAEEEPQCLPRHCLAVDQQAVHVEDERLNGSGLSAPVLRRH